MNQGNCPPGFFMVLARHIVLVKNAHRKIGKILVECN